MTDNFSWDIQGLHETVENEGTGIGSAVCSKFGTSFILALQNESIFSCSLKWFKFKTYNLFLKSFKEWLSIVAHTVIPATWGAEIGELGFEASPGKKPDLTWKKAKVKGLGYRWSTKVLSSSPSSIQKKENTVWKNVSVKSAHLQQFR